MAGDENDAVKLAIAANDIAWLKDTATDTRDAVKELSQYIRNQDEKTAKSGDVVALDHRVEKIEGRVRKLENWRYWLTGAYVIIVGALVVIFEYGKQWFGGGHP